MTLRIVVGPSFVIASVCNPFGGWRLALLAAAFSMACEIVFFLLFFVPFLLFFRGAVL